MNRVLEKITFSICLLIIYDVFFKPSEFFVSLSRQREGKCVGMITRNLVENIFFFPTISDRSSSPSNHKAGIDTPVSHFVFWILFLLNNIYTLLEIYEAFMSNFRLIFKNRKSLCIKDLVHWFENVLPYSLTWVSSRIFWLSSSQKTISVVQHWNIPCKNFEEHQTSIREFVCQEG